MNTSSDNAVWSDQFAQGTDNLENESPEELRDSIQQTRDQMTQTIGAIESRLTPQHIASQVKDTVTTNAQQLTTQAVNRAQALGANAQVQANDLAHAARDQAEYRGQQVREWYSHMSATYPWFVPALIGGGVLAVAGLLTWIVAGRND